MSEQPANDELLERLDDQGLYCKAERIQMIKDAAAEIRRLRTALAQRAQPAAYPVRLDAWIRENFAGHGRALRRESDMPLEGEPWMSMDEAKELTRQAVALFGRATSIPAQYALPPLVDRAELVALLEDLASVNLSPDACSRQAARMADDLIARGLTALTSTYGAPSTRVPKVRTSHHRNKEEAARLQALVDKRCARDGDDAPALPPADGGGK